MSIQNEFVTFTQNEKGEWVQVTKEELEERKDTETKCCDWLEWTYHDDEWCDKTGERLSKHHYTCNHCGEVTQIG